MVLKRFGTVYLIKNGDVDIFAVLETLEQEMLVFRKLHVTSVTDLKSVG